MRNTLNEQGGWSRPFAILNWVRPNPPQTQLNSRSSTQVWFLIACYTSKICNWIRASPDIFEARCEVTKYGPLMYIIKVQVYIIKKILVNGSFY